MDQTKTYTIVETITESFNGEVPAHLEGDELDEYLENERVNGDHERSRVIHDLDIDWWEQ